MCDFFSHVEYYHIIRPSILVIAILDYRYD